MKFVSHFFLFLIFLYQKLISPLLVKSCRYYPSCSTYGQTCFQRFSPLRAMFLTVKRLLRCHPWGGSGIDFPPQ